MAYTVDPKAVNRWTARITPVILMGVVGYATYVLVVRLCVNYLLRATNRRPGAVIAFLVIYFLLFSLMATCYFRILYIVAVDPGYIPRGAGAQLEKHSSAKVTNHRRRRSDKIANGGEYRSSSVRQEPDSDPNSPGLELFYSKDVFVCESDGRPKWCSECCNWKPDRTHHCSDIGRCLRKMDHYCPWVGGVVGEHDFKFFVQFVSYTFLYCTFLVAVMAIYLHEQIKSKESGNSFDPQFAAIIGLGTFFGMFTGGMTASSIQFAICNLTTIENLNKTTKVWQLAAIIPNPTRSRLSISNTNYTTITYPLPLPQDKLIRAPLQYDNESERPSQPVSTSCSPDSQRERDSKATRTFAILRMEPGQNPWDLGTSGNWKTVMGENFLDWFLPVRRSPCCNHESTESQFKIGRWVEQLRAKHGLLPESEVKSPRPRAAHRQERQARERAKDMEMHNLKSPSQRENQAEVR